LEIAKLEYQRRFGRVDVNQSYQAIYENGIYSTATPMPISPTDSLEYFLPLIWGN
jgi:hypothetical protein